MSNILAVGKWARASKGQTKENWLDDCKSGCSGQLFDGGCESHHHHYQHHHRHHHHHLRFAPHATTIAAGQRRNRQKKVYITMINVSNSYNT